MIIKMFSEEPLVSSSFNGRKISYAKTDFYVDGKDLLFGLNDSLEFLKTVPSKSGFRISLIIGTYPMSCTK